MRYRKMSKLIRGDFSYQTHRKRDTMREINQATVMFYILNVLKGGKKDESSDFLQCSC